MKLKDQQFLWLLPFFVFEPTDGAMRSALAICEYLLDEGASVRILTTSFSSNPLLKKLSVSDLMFANSEVVEVARVNIDSFSQVTLVPSQHKQLEIVVLVPASCAGEIEMMPSWPPEARAMFNSTAEGFITNITCVISLDDSAEGRKLRKLAYYRGASTVFYLRHSNLYGRVSRFPVTDALLCASKYIASLHPKGAPIVEGIRAPILSRDTLATDLQREFIVLCNAHPEKGLGLFLSLAQSFSHTLPNEKFLIIEYRGRLKYFLEKLRSRGENYSIPPNLSISLPVDQPKKIFSVAKVTISPSFDEPYGRVASESIMNGIPVICSDTGGFTESARGVETKFPLPKTYVKNPFSIPLEQDIQPWISALNKLLTNPDFYERQSVALRALAKSYLSEEENRRKHISFFLKALAIAERRKAHPTAAPNLQRGDERL